MTTYILWLSDSAHPGSSWTVTTCLLYTFIEKSQNTIMAVPFPYIWISQHELEQLYDIEVFYL